MAAASTQVLLPLQLITLKRSWRLRMILFLVVVVLGINGEGGGTTTTSTTTTSWCVSRSNVSERELQTALDYACGSGADCTPIQPNGLCFLPNTFQAHASYAFNSYYQRKSMAPGSCDFAATATIAMTDPSYGSCVYPSSSSTAGGTITQPTPQMMPTINNPNAPMTPSTTTTPIYGGEIGGYTPGLGPTTPGSSTTYSSQSSTSLLSPSSITIITLLLMTFMYIFVPSFPFKPYFCVCNN